ncbi:MAG TPA: hypothetical protein PKN78_02740 [Tenuifilaceae bacterium]|nr:hypothetical protein [Tenuifilaceae bacterium]
MKLTHNSLRLMVLLSSFVIAGNANALSLGSSDTCKVDYLSFQSGMIIDRYNSLEVRIFFEYQRDIKKKWQWGISYENSRHLGFAATDQPYELETNLNLFSLNGYYKLNVVKNRLFWTAGLGLGMVHAYWEKPLSYTFSEMEHHNIFGPVANVSLTLNVRITKRVYIEASPLVVVMPTNRVYFSTMDEEHFNNFFAFTFFPFGVKFRL